MDKYYEFYVNGEWKNLHVFTDEEALSRSKEFGYPVRKVITYIIEWEFNPATNKEE